MTIIATKPSLLPRSAHGGPLRLAILVVAALTVVAALGTGWFGVAWYRAAHDGSLPTAIARDAVLRDAGRATVTLNTLDYRHVQDGLTLWEQFATGPLLTQLRTNREAYARAITDSATVSTANVLDVAVASLDDRAGSAQVLVGLNVTSQVDQGDPGCTQRRAWLDMVRLGESWKVAALTPIGETYSEPGPCPPATPPK